MYARRQPVRVPPEPDNVAKPCPAVHPEGPWRPRSERKVVVVIVIAHRGLPSADRPENTVAAVRAALRCGADGVEVDVRLTADGVLAVSHDPGLGRLTVSDLPVATSTWEQLRQAASSSGLVLACVEDVLLAAQGRRVVLELKKPPPGQGAARRTALAVAGQLRLLQRQGLALEVTVSSFSPELVGHVRVLLPARTGVRTALLGRPLDRPSGLLRHAVEAGHDEVQPHVLALRATPQVVAAAHRLGVAVCPWTVNRPSDVRRFERLGVDALITDVPAEVKVAVGVAA